MVQLTRFGKIVFGVVILLVLLVVVSISSVNYFFKTIDCPGDCEWGSVANKPTAQNPLNLQTEIKMNYNSTVAFDFQFFNAGDAIVNARPMVTECLNDKGLTLFSVPLIESESFDIKYEETQTFDVTFSVKGLTEFAQGKTVVCEMAILNEQNHSRIYDTSDFYLTIRKPSS